MIDGGNKMNMKGRCRISKSSFENKNIHGHEGQGYLRD